MELVVCGFNLGLSEMGPIGKMVFNCCWEGFETVDSIPSLIIKFIETI